MRYVNAITISLLTALVLAAGAGSAASDEVFGYEEWQQAVNELFDDPRDVVYPFEVTDGAAAGLLRSR